MLQKQHSASSFYPSHKAATQASYCIHQPPALKSLRWALKNNKKNHNKKNGNPVKFLSSKICTPNAAGNFTWEEDIGWHRREIHWPHDAPERPPAHKSKRSKEVSSDFAIRCTYVIKRLYMPRCGMSLYYSLCFQLLYITEKNSNFFPHV